METLQQKIKLLPTLLLLLCLLPVSNPVLAESESQDAVKSPQKTLNLSGLYLGYYPCDDCKGIRTTLALNSNNTYVYISLYTGKSDREIVEKGKFAIGDNGDTLILTPKKGSSVTQHYLIDDEMLVKLDENGDRITKDGADRFILKRKDVVRVRDNNHAAH